MRPIQRVVELLFGPVNPDNHDVVAYAIQDGRGFDDAAAVLGAAFNGVLVRDGWAPYRQFEQVAHQTCLAHRIRRCGELAKAHPRTA